MNPYSAAGGEILSRECSWDAIVIGAGVAGAAAALGLAQRLGGGARILLVERCEWPRPKVCGCCLNATAVAALDRLGVLSSVKRAGPVLLESVRIRRERRMRCLRIAPGLGLAREILDGCLVEAAVRAGVEMDERDGHEA